MERILAITDMDSNGSGYKNICVPILTGLVGLGYEVKVAGLTYNGEEHNYPFSIVPAKTVEDGKSIVQNLTYLWQPDVILVALDLPLQARMFSELAPYLKRTEQETKEGKTSPRKYFCITPLENGPLSMSWAAPLFNMDAVFFISELGKQEAIKAGVSKAEHLLIGVDTVSWRPSTPEERQRLREGLGIPQDAFVVLTVADNQERKNLSAGMESISLLIHDGMTHQDILEGKVRQFPKTNTNVRYVLVTREQSPFGWNLRDLSITLDITQEYVCFERGLSQKDLWGLYAIADAYLQPSKAEGLGMPVLDAMACGVPVVATDTGAMHEILWGDGTDDEGERGLLVDTQMEFIDVWGNSKRGMISVEQCKSALWSVSVGLNNKFKMRTDAALAYAKSRTWSIPVHQIHDKIQELCNG